MWPVEGNQISIDGKPVSSPKVDNQTGVAWFGGYEHVEMCDVTYTGGYEPCDFPPDLLAVLVGSITHAFEITSGGASASDSPISKVTIPDVGTVTYDVKSSNSLISYIGGIIPAYYQSVLDLYRLHEC